MSDIFISYARKDRQQAANLVHCFKTQGWSVFWDGTIRTGVPFDEIIEEELDTAKCVIVLWSENSVKRQWVRNEARDGANREILVPVLIENVKIPVEFSHLQTANLIDWDGSDTASAFKKLVGDISFLLDHSQREKRNRSMWNLKQISKPGEKKHRVKKTTMTPKVRESFVREPESSMVHIPGGTFTMGDEKDNDNPAHKVTLDDFYIGSTPVTQEQYEAITGINPSYFKGPKRPVENVSWNDAKVFCDILSQKTGKNYTLPTEAQWEYACSGSKNFEYGTDDGTLDPSKANYFESIIIQTTNVVNYPANPFGLYDMSGNVWEWCNDWYGKDYYLSSSPNNPEGPATGSNRILRGGSWISSAYCSRSSFRRNDLPDILNIMFGFRVVRRLS